MTEQMRLLGDAELRLAALQLDPAMGDADEPRDHAQQRRLAGAVVAADQQGGPGIERKIKAREYVAAAAHARQVARQQAHQGHPRWPAAAPVACACAQSRILVVGMSLRPLVFLALAGKRPYKPQLTRRRNQADHAKRRSSRK